MAVTIGAQAPTASDGEQETMTEPSAVPMGQIKIPSKKKVCIIGFADSRLQAPFDDDSYEFWGVNEMWADKAVKKTDVLFELHDLKWIKEGKKIKDHYKWLCENETIPVFMQSHYPEIPMSIPFPRDILKQAFRVYYTNTISWEIALAIHLGFEEIRIYGVNMATAEEYAGQRPSVEYYIGLAEGKGISVYIPPECDLLKCMYDYGFEDGELSIMATKLQAEIDSQNGKVQALQNQINSATAQMFQAQGAASAIDYIKKGFIYPNANFIAEKSSGG